MLPVDNVQMEILWMSDIGLGKIIYTKKLEEFVAFQDSQGTCHAYLAETAEMVYTGRNSLKECGLIPGTQVHGEASVS
jgi:hypothetical protein